MRKIFIPAVIVIICVSFGFIFFSEIKPDKTTENKISINIQQVDTDSTTIKVLSHSIPTGKATELETKIYFPVGELRITSGSKQLSSASLQYFKDIWEPEFSYEESDHKGYLKFMYDRRLMNHHFGNYDQSEWDIQFNKDIRNDLTIKCIAGEGYINLQDCNVEIFDFTMTAGEMEINLRNSSVPRLIFSALAGDVVLDLSGNWQNDLNANIKGGVGELVIKLPSGTGIQLHVNGLIGDIDAEGFHKEGRIYTNNMYGKTDETLYIDCTLGIGSLEVIMID